MKQIEIHNKIDSFFKREVNSASTKVAYDLIMHNTDAKRYFFSIANEAWIKWLWAKDFFSELKKPSKDTTVYSYRLPELEYLTRMVEKDPQTVSDIINSVSISKTTFNPEVVDRFFWITGLLPVQYIKMILPKILTENWVQLMSPFNRSGYEYKKIAEKVIEAKDWDALIILAKIILTIRTREELDAMEKFSIADKLFYLHDITETGIFEAVLEIDATKREEVLGVLIGILSKVVNLGEDKEEMTFAKAEPFYLLNVDMFNLELDLDNRSYSREDIQNLVAINKKLVEKIYISIDNNEAEARRIYETYIKPLPDSRTLWKLRLYVITRCPQFFEAEIKEALLRLFNAEERYFDINSGTEYHYSLMAGFALLDKDFKREYIKKVFEYFGADLNDKDKEGWRKRDGLILATYIKADMNKTEIAHSEVLFGKFPDKAPIPDTGMSEVAGGFVNHKSPFTLSDFNVDQIIEHLKTDWDPKLLNEKFKNDDFLNPRGTEGLGDALKDDLKLRTQDYFTKLNAFFDRTAIDPSYVYSLMRGVDEMLRNKQSLSDVQYVALINFFDSIRVSGEKEEFKKFDDKKSWLADWITVHKIMADILLNSLGYINESEVFTKNRDIILNLVKYLLSIKSSPNSEEEKPEYGEPSHIAINSVRGQAYRALVQFTYNDGKSLAGDVKRIYEDVLDSDSSTAVRFTAGQFLASFYFRDKAFIKSLLPKIFPKDTVGKEKLYFATWEGYLASALYEELYELLAEYYEYAITLKKEQYPERKYLKGLDETLAGHMALAYAQFNLKIGDPLFNSFWNTPSETRHYEFTSFTGRHYLTRSQAGDEWMAENKVSKTKIIDFWNWILKTEIPVEAKTFSGFGFWVNPDKEVISDEIVIVNMAESLKKSLGVIDWDYGLLQRINKFAEINPEKTLEIIARLLILNDGLNPHHRTYFDASRQIKEPLEIIYKIPSLKKPVEDLVNMLIEKGSSTFWDLKKIMTE